MLELAGCFIGSLQGEQKTIISYWKYEGGACCCGFNAHIFDGMILEQFD